MYIPIGWLTYSPEGLPPPELEGPGGPLPRLQDCKRGPVYILYVSLCVCACVRVCMCVCVGVWVCECVGVWIGKGPVKHFHR